MPTQAVQIRAGQVDVNAEPFNPRTPFGGYKHFGIRREIADSGIDDMLKLKAVHCDRRMSRQGRRRWCPVRWTKPYA